MSALVHQQDLVPITMSEIAWQPEGQMSFEQWEQAGLALQRMGRAWQWWVGDWVLYGERHFADTYSQAVDLTGYEYKTISQVIRVSGAITPPRRKPELSWSHHEAVAALPVEQQDEWLGKAVEDGMTVARLRTRMRGLPDPEEGRQQVVGDVYTALVRYRFTATSADDAQDRLDRITARGVQDGAASHVVGGPTSGDDPC